MDVGESSQTGSFLPEVSAILWVRGSWAPTLLMAVYRLLLWSCMTRGSQAAP